MFLHTLHRGNNKVEGNQDAKVEADTEPKVEAAAQTENNEESNGGETSKFKASNGEHATEEVTVYNNYLLFFCRQTSATFLSKTQILMSSGH